MAESRQQGPPLEHARTVLRFARDFLELICAAKILDERKPIAENNRGDTPPPKDQVVALRTCIFGHALFVGALVRATGLMP